MRSSSSNAILALLGCALLGLVACGRDEPEAAPEEAPRSTVEVETISIGRAVGEDRRVTDETTTFRPTDTIYLSFQLDGAGETAKLAAEWIHEDGRVVAKNSRTSKINGPTVFEFHASQPRGWPAGNYEAVITLDGREIHRRTFTVQEG